MGIAGLSLPLVETLGGPVGVGVAGTVLVVAVVTSRVVGKGRGIAGLSLPLVVPSSVVRLVIGAKKASAQETAADQGEGRDGKELGGPLVEAVSTLGRPVGVGVAGAVLVVSVTASRVVGKGRGIAGLMLPLVETLGRPVGVGVAGTVLVVSVTASGVVGKGRGVAGLSLPLEN